MIASIAVIAITFLLGHDALMAMTQHADASDHAEHHPVVTEMCGATDGVLAQAPGVQLLPTPAILATAVALPTFHEQSRGGHTPIFAIDGATQRALLQVFLN